MGDFYNPKPLVTMQRFRLYSRFHQPEESVSTFVAQLRNLAKDCNFGATLEDNSRDRLVCGIADQVLQKRLLSEQNLTFKKAFEIAQSHESAARNIVTLQGSSEVHQLKNDTNFLSATGVDVRVIRIPNASLNLQLVIFVAKLVTSSWYVVLGIRLVFNIHPRRFPITHRPSHRLVQQLHRLVHLTRRTVHRPIYLFFTVCLALQPHTHP